MSSSSSSTTSLQIFREFLTWLPDGSVNAERIHSVECYERWLASREMEDCPPSAKKFARALSNHVTGVDGRSAFELEEERAILKVLRLKSRWPCFPNRAVGLGGFRAKGYHEKVELGIPPASSLAAAAAAAASASTVASDLGDDINNDEDAGGEKGDEEILELPVLRPKKRSKKMHKIASNLSLVSTTSHSSGAGESPALFYLPPLFTVAASAETTFPASPSRFAWPSSSTAAAEDGDNGVASATSPHSNAPTSQIIDQLVAYIRSFPEFGEGELRSVLQVFRLLMIANSPVCSISVPQIHAKQMCAAVSYHKGPDNFVCLVDMTAKDNDKHVVAQNALGERTFGSVIEKFAAKLLHPRDIERLLTSAMHALHNPGREYFIPSLRFTCAGGDVQQFDTSLAVDPLSFLFVFTGRANTAHNSGLRDA